MLTAQYETKIMQSWFGGSQWICSLRSVTVLSSLSFLKQYGQHSRIKKGLVIVSEKLKKKCYSIFALHCPGKTYQSVCTSLYLRYLRWKVVQVPQFWDCSDMVSAVIWHANTQHHLNSASSFMSMRPVCCYRWGPKRKRSGNAVHSPKSPSHIPGWLLWDMSRVRHNK